MVKQLKGVKAKVSDFHGPSLVDDKMAAVAPPITMSAIQAGETKRMRTKGANLARIPLKEHTSTTLAMGGHHLYRNFCLLLISKC